MRTTDGKVVDPNIYVYGNEGKVLKKIRQKGSRRIKVAIRRLSRQELSEAAVLHGVRTLKKAIKNKEQQ
jgi:hypothetical protein